MTNIELKILELIKNSHSLNEISEITNLSPKQVFCYINLLSNKGYNFDKKYYSDGNIRYYLNYGLENDSNFAIITPPDMKKIEFLVISDTHLSSSKENLYLLNKAYDYCVKNDIHLNLIPGDIIDGFIGHLPKKFNTSHEQIEYCIKNFPFDKNILNFLVLGNHDYSTLASYGQDLKKALTNRRYDMIVTGYGEGKIHIKNDFIILRHPLKLVKEENELCSKTLIIKGHTHRFKMWYDYDNCVLYAPTLSNINNENTLPGMIHLTLELLNGYIKKCVIKNLVYLNKTFYTIGEGEVYLGNSKPFQRKKDILYEEDIKVLKK